MRSSINLKVNEVSFECFQKGELLIKSVYCIAMMYDGSVLFVNEPFMIQSKPSGTSREVYVFLKIFSLVFRLSVQCGHKK